MKVKNFDPDTCLKKTEDLRNTETIDCVGYHLQALFLWLMIDNRENWVAVVLYFTCKKPSYANTLHKYMSVVTHEPSPPRLHCQTVIGQLWALTFPLISANICMTVALCRRPRWTSKCGRTIFSEIWPI